MLKDTNITEVIFRVDKTKGFEGTIYAILPHEVFDRRGNVTTYQNIGQHSGGDYFACLETSRPANELESADLLAEMLSLGYNIKVIKRQDRSKFLKSYYEAK